MRIFQSEQVIKLDYHVWARCWDTITQFNLSVESNQNVESKRKSVESRNRKCGVQNFAKSLYNDDDWRVPHISVKRAWAAPL